MNASTAIFAGLSLIALAIYASNSDPALSQSGSSGGFGPWNVKVEKLGEVPWLLNSSNGNFYRCTEEKCTKLPME